jgi:hypothetical protein
MTKVEEPGSGILAGFHALRLTEPRSGSGRGPKVPRHSQKDRRDTPEGKTNNGRCGSTALPERCPLPGLLFATGRG